MSYNNDRILNAFEEGVVVGIIHMLEKRDADLKVELEKHLREYGLTEDSIFYWKDWFKDTIYADEQKEFK